MKKAFLIGFILLAAASTTEAQEIFDAVKADDIAKVKSIIGVSPQIVNIKDETGRTPLHWACRGVYFDILKLLVENGANVNAKDSNGIAPLHSLTTRAHIDGTTFLLSEKADINIMTNSGDTPLHYAVRSTNDGIVKLLLENNAEHSVKNRNGDTPLNIAVMSRNKVVVEMLLEKGAKYDGAGNKALSMLQISARNGFEKLFIRTVEKEGDALFADKENNKWTIQDVVTGGNVELMKLLEGKNVTMQKNADIYGWTLIHYAAINRRYAMLEYLAKQDININERTKAGETAYNLAEINNDKEMIELIEKLGGKKDAVEFPVLKGKYFGQKPPGMKPEIFAPGIISRPNMRELTITFSPDDQEIFFYRVLAGNFSKIYQSKVVNGKWIAPEEMKITSTYSATLPFIPLDNKRMFFGWNNPQHPFEVWVTDRAKEGWSQPKCAGPGFFLSQDNTGQLYITEISSDNRQTYISKVKYENDRFTSYERINFPEQDRYRAQPCVALDGSYIIFDHGEGDHIQISFKKKDGTWGKVIDLTENGFEPLTGIPTISRDGKYLFFKVGCRGQYDIGHGDTNRDVWWVDIKAIERLRPKE